MLTAYIKAAMRLAKYEFIEEDDLFFHYASIPDLPGTYGCASTHRRCEDDLRSAINDRIALSIEEGLPIPPIEGISIDPASAELLRLMDDYIYIHSMMTNDDKIIQLPNLEEIPGALVERIVVAAGIEEEDWDKAATEEE